MSSTSVIEGLGYAYPTYLKSETEIIPLRIVKVFRGQRSLSQALVKPQKLLTIGYTYTLIIDNLNEFEKEDFVNEMRSYRVIGEKDTLKPAWRMEPVFHSKSFTQYGCGPVKLVNFCIRIEDGSPTLVWAKVKNNGMGNTQEYLQYDDSTQISIGHGMCAGAFNFQEGYTYEASFALLDASGNTSATYSKPFQFRGPDAENAQFIDYNATKPCACMQGKNVKSSLSSWSTPPITLLAVFILTSFLLWGLLVLTGPKV